MSALSIQPTFPTFTDIDGQPLEAGYIFIGTANLNPITNPISVFFDAALTQPAVQPIRTISGYPSNAGTPGRLYVNSDYSIQVQNKNGTVVYSSPTATERYNEIVINGINAEDVVYDPPFAGAVSTNVEAKLEQMVSVKDFGAVGDGVADDTTAIQAALTAGGLIFFPDGNYKITGTLTVSSNSKIFGSQGSKVTYTNGACVFLLNSISNVEISNLEIDGNKGSYLIGANQNPFGVQMEGCENIWVHDNYIHDCYRIGVNVGQTSPSEYIWVQDNRIENIGSPLDPVGGYGNGVAVVNGENVYIERNIITGTHGTGGVNIEPNAATDSAYNIYVRGNIITGGVNSSRGVQLYMAAGVPVPPYHGIYICDNIIDSDNTDITIVRSGDVWISNNDCRNSGISVINSDDAEVHILNNNTVASIAVNGYKTLYCHGNYIENSSTVGMFITDNSIAGIFTSIKGNIIDSPQSHGIEISALNMVLEGNYFFSVGQGGGAYAVDYVTGAWGGTIANNALRQSSGTCLAMFNAEGSVCQDVTFSGNQISPTTIPEANLFGFIGVATGLKLGAAPSAGTWRRGDIVYDIAPTAGGYVGFVCVTAGTPGTWKTFGEISL